MSDEGVTSPDPVNDEEDEDDDEDSFAGDTSEDTDERRAFNDKLYRFMRDRGTPIGKLPQLGGRMLDLYKLYKEVIVRGGTEVVSAVIILSSKKTTD